MQWLWLVLALFISQCGDEPMVSQVLSTTETAPGAGTPEDPTQEISEPPSEKIYTEELIGSNTLTGTVRDSNFVAINGLNIRLVNVSDPNIQTARVSGMNGNFDGSFTLHHLPAGTYKVITERLDGRGVGLLPDVIDNLLLMAEPTLAYPDQVDIVTLDATQLETDLEIIIGE